MGFHFVPLLAGVAMGAVATYLYKDKKARSAIAEKMPKFGTDGEAVVSAQPIPVKNDAESSPSEHSSA
ncbi:MAG: hypothetical protein CSA50_04965 [Gammaproteobacteria bacterium]|nr:MAG: hypothetical protein CSA50_04965 [Gammaproteobacteria bacterium]